MPTTAEMEGDRFTVVRDGRRMATPLLLALVTVEVTDLVFAVDSIPAIFAVTQEPFLVFASNALAILGLRAMYFLLADLMHRFVYLKLGLSLVLVWVGVKMIVSHAVFKIPTAISLGIVIAIIAISIGASLWVSRGKEVGGDPAEATPDAAEGAPGTAEKALGGDSGITSGSVENAGSTDSTDSTDNPTTEGRKDALKP